MSRTPLFVFALRCIALLWVPAAAISVTGTTPPVAPVAPFSAVPTADMVKKKIEPSPLISGAASRG